METIGQILKKTREEKGLNIEEVSKQTKIHHRVIEALESDKFKELPSAPIYVRGFIRRYAKFLTLDTDNLVKRYISEYPERPKQVFVLDEIKFGAGASRFSQYVTPLVTGLILAIVILIIYSLGLSLLKGKTSGRAPVIHESEISSRAGREPEVIRGPGAEPGRVTLPEESVARLEAEGELLRLKVSVKDDCWLEVRCDDKAVFRGTLKKGTSELWEARDNISIWSGKAEVMSLELNGRVLGSPGEGVMKNIVVTKKGFEVK